jgi:hypothetical protein
MLVENPRDIEYCKQLLPFPGRSIEVVTVEKSQQNDFSIVSESQSSTMENEETNEVCACMVIDAAFKFLLNVKWNEKSLQLNEL